MRYLVRHFPNAYRLNGRPAECDLAFNLQAKVGINRQGLQFLFLRRRWSMCLLRGVSISLPLRTPPSTGSRVRSRCDSDTRQGHSVVGIQIDRLLMAAQARSYCGHGNRRLLSSLTHLAPAAEAPLASTPARSYHDGQIFHVRIGGGFSKAAVFQVASCKVAGFPRGWAR